MERFNCLSKKAQPDLDDQPLAPRPIYVFRSKESKSKSKVPANIEIKQPPVQRPLRTPSRNAMNNAARRGAAGGNVPPVNQNYIEISDDEYDDDDGGMNVPVASRHEGMIAAEENELPQRGLPSLEGQGQEDLDLAAFVIEDGDEFDVNDPELARLMMEGFGRERDEHAAARAPSAQPNQPVERPALSDQETRIQCIEQVIAVFPGICRDYVSGLYETKVQSSDFLIGHIFEEKVEKNIQYPKAKDTQKSLKRKRDLDEDEEAARKYGSVDRVIPDGPAGLRPFIRILLSKDFAETPMTFIDSALNQSGYRLFSTYIVLEEAHRTFDAQNPTYNKVKNQNKARRMDNDYTDANLETTIQRMSQSGYQIQDAEVLKELQAARRIRKKAEARVLAERLAEVEEVKNLQKAEAEGTMSECGCCFGDFPLNRMVHCDSIKTLHFFCRTCAKSNADTEIGNSKYILKCMSMDGCDAGFSLDQRKQFLDKTTIVALERNEQEANLRMCGIENLASCPFCPYAAEYPPIETDREFRCQAEECEKVSCRLCKLESHIPKSCEEHAKDNGLSIRRQIEEAMSAALIRKCNKCETPFVKEEGCNKMTCTRNGCRNIQCYVCSKSCDYNHFDDARRGGKAGNCPLFESVEDRHDNEVKKAEKEALAKVRAEHPEYTEEDLKVKMSENVMKDDERRKANDPRMAHLLQVRGGLPDRFAPMPVGYMPAPLALPRPVIRLQPGPVPPQRFAPIFPQEVFAAADFGRPLDVQMFAGLWDNRLDGGPPQLQPRPQGRQYYPQIPSRGVPNQPGQAGASAFSPRREPLNPWNFVPQGPVHGTGMAQEGPHMLQTLRPRSIRAGHPSIVAQPALPLNVNPPLVDPQLHPQQLRLNLTQLQQLPGNVQAQQHRDIGGQLAQRILSGPRFGPAIAAQHSHPQMQGAAAERMGGINRRVADRPLNPPNGQA